MAEMHQASPAPSPPASPSFAASKIAVSGLNRLQKRALLLVRKCGSWSVPNTPKSPIVAPLPDECPSYTRSKAAPNDVRKYHSGTPFTAQCPPTRGQKPLPTTPQKAFPNQGPIHTIFRTAIFSRSPGDAKVAIDASTGTPKRGSLWLFIPAILWGRDPDPETIPAPEPP